MDEKKALSVGQGLFYNSGFNTGKLISAFFDVELRKGLVMVVGVINVAVLGVNKAVFPAIDLEIIDIGFFVAALW